MEWKVTDRKDTGDVMLLPFWQSKSKPPHNSLNGLTRSAISNVKSALSGQRFDGKVGSTLSLWSDDCRVILIGMGEIDNLTHKIARDAGAKAIAGLSKKDGTNLTVRFTTGWNLEAMKWFIEGMMLRDYAFLKYRKKDREAVSYTHLTLPTNREV